jgi:phosphate transport system permease protein
MQRKTHGRAQALGEGVFRGAALTCAAFVLVAMLAIFAELVRHSHLSLAKFGLGFLWSDVWNPVTETFGAASSIFGSVVSTVIALVIAIELLAAIPSIIYGMWGLFVLAPVMADHVQPALQKVFGDLPLVQGPPMGIGVLTAGIVLALMVLPFITAVVRDVFALVPPVMKEAGYGMGATTLEVTRKVTVRYGMRGIIGGVFLGLGRAIGETMAVTFVIGNDHRIASSLFASGNTIASTLANEFTEASEPIYLSALVELGLILFVLTFLIQIVAQLWLKRVAARLGIE